MTIADKKFFHGPFYTEIGWSSPAHSCCKLCKTQNSEGRHRHWAKGLCRSCYRRLSITHRLYNDNWNRPDSEDDLRKKDYKKKDPKDIVFDDLDIVTLLDRYDWKCAYSKVPLQGHSHCHSNAFQLEYLILDDGNVTLVPVSRSVNCSKKGLNNPEQLRKWAQERDLEYPFNFTTVEGLLQK